MQVRPVWTDLQIAQGYRLRRIADCGGLQIGQRWWSVTRVAGMLPVSPVVLGGQAYVSNAKAHVQLCAQASLCAASAPRLHYRLLTLCPAAY